MKFPAMTIDTSNSRFLVRSWVKCMDKASKLSQPKLLQTQQVKRKSGLGSAGSGGGSMFSGFSPESKLGVLGIPAASSAPPEGN